jgi:hypothetical protein
MFSNILFLFVNGLSYFRMTYSDLEHTLMIFQFFGLIGSLAYLAVWPIWHFGLFGTLAYLALWLIWHFGTLAYLAL